MHSHGSASNPTSNDSRQTNNSTTNDSIHDHSNHDNSQNDHSHHDNSQHDHSQHDHSQHDHSQHDHSNHDHSSTSNHTHTHAPNPLPPSLSQNMNLNAPILSSANTTSTHPNSRISHPLPPSYNASAPILTFANHESTHTHLLDPAIPSHTNDPYTRLRDLNKENNRNRRANRSNRSNRRATRSNDDSDSERSRSRDRQRNVSSRRVSSILIPSFQNVEEIDKIECINIYRAVYESETASTLPSNIIKEIAEYAIGVIYVCDNYVCNNEILKTNSTNYGGYYSNPQALAQNEGNVDVNQSLNVFCNSCYNGIRQCSLHFTPFVLQDQFHQNIFIFNGSNRQSLSEMVNFKNIYCSNRFMNTGMKYCNQCIAGRQVFIGNYCINIACDTNYKKYSIGAESHTYYNYGGHSHENVGGQGGINIHNNVRRARNYNYM